MEDIRAKIIEKIRRLVDSALVVFCSSVKSTDFLDSDDLWHGGMAARILFCVEQYPDCTWN